MEMMTIRNVVLLAFRLRDCSRRRSRSGGPSCGRCRIFLHQGGGPTEFPKDFVANKGMAIIAGARRSCVLIRSVALDGRVDGNYLTEDGVSFRGNHGASRTYQGQNLAAARGRLGRCPGSFADPRKEPFGPLRRARPNGAAVMWPMTRWCSVTPWAMCNFQTGQCGAGRSNRLYAQPATRRAERGSGHAGV